MGVVYRASCPKCGYNEEFYLGGGLMSIRPALALRALDGEDLAKVRQMQETGRTSLFMTENFLVSCPCGEYRLKQKPIVTVTDVDGVQHVFGDRCEACGGKLVRYDPAGKEDAVPCPDCGERLVFQNIGLWD